MTSRRHTEPDPFELIGDVLLVDGEIVAELRPGLRASLRERLEELIWDAVKGPYEIDEDEDDEDDAA